MESVSTPRDTRGGKLFPLWDQGPAGWRPMGLPMAQNRLAIPTWSYAFERVPPARVIEIGSFTGGFALALAVHLWAIKACSPSWETAPPVVLTTYDVMHPNDTIAPMARTLGVVFRVADVFEPRITVEIERLIKAPGTTYLLCDGGNKARELDVFAPFLKPGDVIAAHDYSADMMSAIDDQAWPWCETQRADGDRAAAACDLAPFMQDHFDLAGWLAYRKRGK